MVHLKNLPLHMPVLIHTPLCSFIPPKRSFLPPRAKRYPPALICTTPAIIYSTTIENVIALLMPMMSYNYLIWVGRSPAHLISFFRPSIQNFSGEPPLAGTRHYSNVSNFFPPLAAKFDAAQEDIHIFVENPVYQYRQ